jgi:four helix bundle protein
MAKVTNFEELTIWQEARKLVKLCYQLGATSGIKHDFAFRDQLQRAAISIMSNIAEGFERGTNPDFVRFLNIAKGSCGEVRSLLYAAEDIGHLPKGSTQTLRETCASLSRQISALITFLNNRTTTPATKATNRR